MWTDFALPHTSTQMNKFIELMSTSNMKDLRKLAEFATIIIRKFQ